jgi:hypothetical protein
MAWVLDPPALVVEEGGISFAEMSECGLIVK